MPVPTLGNRYFFYTSHMHKIRLIASDLDGTLLLNGAQDLKEADFTFISSGKNNPDTEALVSGLHTCCIRKGNPSFYSAYICADTRAYHYGLKNLKKRESGQTLPFPFVLKPFLE